MYFTTMTHRDELFDLSLRWLNDDFRVEDGAALSRIFLYESVISAAVVQVWAIRKLIAWMGERSTAVFGLVMTITAMLILAVVTNGVYVFVFMPITALGVVVGTALQGMMADRVPDDAQGELQGAVSSVGAISVILSPVLMTSVFGAFTREGAPVYLPGAPFLAAAALALLVSRPALRPA